MQFGHEVDRYGELFIYIVDKVNVNVKSPTIYDDKSYIDKHR